MACDGAGFKRKGSLYSRTEKHGTVGVMRRPNPVLHACTAAHCSDSATVSARSQPDGRLTHNSNTAQGVRARSREENLGQNYAPKFGPNFAGANFGVFTRENLGQNFVNNFTQIFSQIVVGEHYFGQNQGVTLERKHHPGTQGHLRSPPNLKESPSCALIPSHTSHRPVSCQIGFTMGSISVRSS